MGKTGLTIKNITVSFIFFVILFSPDLLSAWFSEGGEAEMPYFKKPLASDTLYSDTYVLLHNRERQPREFFLFPDSKFNYYVVADSVSIDIPLDVLSRNAIDPGEYIDRLLTVNLRIKKILDEYSKLDKKIELFSNDYGVRFQKGLNPTKRNWFVSSIRSPSVSAEKKKLSKNLSNALKSSQSYRVETKKNRQRSVAVLARLNKKEASNTITAPQPPIQATELEMQRESSTISMTKHIDDELPWIFNVVLEGIRYCINHKVQIILFVLFVIVIIPLIPLKRKI